MVWPRPKYVGGRQVRDALVISQVIVVGDGPFNVAGNPTEFRGLDRCAIQPVMAWEWGQPIRDVFRDYFAREWPEHRSPRW